MKSTPLNLSHLWVACADIVSGEVALRFRLVRFKVAFPPISIGVFDNDYDVIHFEGELIGVYRLIIVHRIHKLLCWFLNSLICLSSGILQFDVISWKPPALFFYQEPSTIFLPTTLSRFSSSLARTLLWSATVARRSSPCNRQ